MTTEIVVFPFDLFGSRGTAAGADLLADELREILEDNQNETVATRADAYAPHVRLHEESFETLGDYEGWRDLGRRLAGQCLRKNELFFWLSGNHLGALPVYEEIARTDASTLIVQLDAHLDVHHFEDCTKELSNGNFLLHATEPLPPLINVGHRDLLLPQSYVEQFFEQTFPMAELVRDASQVMDRLSARIEQADKIFLDLDCDCFDSSFFPAVNRPVPMGLTPQQVLLVVETIWSDKLAGVMVSEFAPDCDQQDRSLAILVWLIEYLLIRKYERDQ